VLRSENSLRARAIVAIGIVACLAIGGCGSKNTGTTNHATVSDGSAPAPEISPVSAEPSTAAPGDGAGSGYGSGSGSGDAKSSSGVPLKVTAVIDPIVPAAVVTNDCPYAYTMRATVSVNKGPVDLLYQWRRGTEPGVAQPLHFGGTGAQSKVVTLSSTDVAYDMDVGRVLQILDQDHVVILSSVRTLHLTCGVKVSTVQPVVPPTHCPYVTNFSVTFTAAVAQHVSFEWHLGDGTVVQDAANVPGGFIPFTATVSNVKVAASGLTGAYYITLRVTSVGGGTATGTVQCPSVNT